MTVAHLLIFGRVQGVGFRKFVKREARKLGLVGWVRNVPEGIHLAGSGQVVEAEVGGAREAVEKLIAHCRKGPFLAEVVSVETEWIEKAFPYTDFLLKHELN